MNKKLKNIICASCLVAPSVMLAGCDLLSSHKEHSYGSEWTIDGTHHWHKCDGCKEVDGKAEHRWNAGIVITPETGHEDGSKLVVCEDCGASATIAIPKNIALVTAKEWEDAFLMEDVNDVKIEMAGVNLIIDGDNAYNTTLSGSEVYTTIQADKYVKYFKEGGVWAKTEITESEYETYHNVATIMDRFSGLNFSDFTYNATTKSYDAENVTGLGVSDTNTVQIFFENQKVMAIDIIVGSVKDSIKFDYSNQTLIMPQKMVALNEWKNAFAFDYDNYQMSLIQNVINSSATQTTEGVVRKYGNTTYIAGITAYDQYSTIDNGKYYVYKNDAGVWTKSEVLEQDFNAYTVPKSFEMFTENGIFAAFSFNAATGAYEASNIQLEHVLIESMQVFFEEDKIYKIITETVSDGLNIEAEATFTYAEVNVELPSQFESEATHYITKQEMLAAIDFLNIANYQAYEVIAGVPGDYILKKDGAKFGLFDASGNLISATNIEGGKYYSYVRASAWTKDEILESKYLERNVAYATVCLVGSTPTEIVDKLTFNSTTNAYEVYDVQDGVNYYDVIGFYFEDLKLVKIVIDGDELVLSYNNDVVELPESYVTLSSSIVSKQEMVDVLTFANIGKVQLKLAYNGEFDDGEYKKDGNTVYMIDPGDNEGIFATIENGEYYIYIKNGTWTKSACNQDQWCDVNKFQTMFNYMDIDLEELVDMLTYDPITRAYKASGFVFDGVDVEDASFYFEDSKISKITFYDGEDMLELHYSYEDEALNLPVIYTDIPEPYVTNQEMATAFDFESVNNYQLTVVNSNSQEIYLAIKDGTSFYQGDSDDQFFAEIKEGKYYMYSRDGVWVREEIDFDRYSQFDVAKAMFAALSLDAEELIESCRYSYDKGAYIVNDVQFAGDTVSSVYFYFADGKLSRVILYRYSGVITTIDFAYENEDVTMPNLQESLVTLDEWNSALIFEGVSQYKLTAEQDNGETADFMVDGDKVCIGDGTDDINNQFYTKEGTNYYYYYYSTNSNQWEKESSEEAVYNQRKNPMGLHVLTGITKYEEFTHNIETGAYEATNVEGFDMSTPMDKVSLTFKNGKLIKVVMELGGETMLVTIEYDDILVTLPTV